MKSDLSTKSFSIFTGEAEVKASMLISSKAMRNFGLINIFTVKRRSGSHYGNDEKTFSLLKFWTIAIEDEGVLSLM
jgi:hypothetical protein